MKTYYEQKDYPNAVIYAEKVLSNPKTDDKVKSDAQIIIARSAIQTNDEPKARIAYAKLLTIAKGELAAEALYYDAYFKNKDGKFEASNTTVQKLTKDYSGYKYFGAKGLVVMAKNFYGLKTVFKQLYILESVIKNFSNFSDVKEEAQQQLDEIKLQEAKLIHPFRIRHLDQTNIIETKIMRNLKDIIFKLKFGRWHETNAFKMTLSFPDSENSD